MKGKSSVIDFSATTELYDGENHAQVMAVPLREVVYFIEKLADIYPALSGLEKINEQISQYNKLRVPTNISLLRYSFHHENVLYLYFTLFQTKFSMIKKIRVPLIMNRILHLY